MSNYTQMCRCCGTRVRFADSAPICTRCIPRHWGKHERGINASRCKEFGPKLRAARLMAAHHFTSGRSGDIPDAYSAHPFRAAWERGWEEARLANA